mgnify:CR=1 FL=1
MLITQKIFQAIAETIQEKFAEETAMQEITLQKTRKEFEGDFTLVVFPFAKIAKASPEATAALIGNALLEKVPELAAFNVIKGFLNLSLSNSYWIDFLSSAAGNQNFGYHQLNDEPPVVVEYSSPNTNKPLHLGHVRNNLLGYSVAKIIEASGKKVVKVNLVNDRGIHICKSMLAWMKYANGETPQSAGKKGDKQIGRAHV